MDSLPWWMNLFNQIKNNMQSNKLVRAHKSFSYFSYYFHSVPIIITNLHILFICLFLLQDFLVCFIQIHPSLLFVEIDIFFIYGLKWLYQHFMDMRADNRHNKPSFAHQMLLFLSCISYLHHLNSFGSPIWNVHIWFKTTKSYASIFLKFWILTLFMKLKKFKILKIFF